MPLNLSELSLATNYGRVALARMGFTRTKLPGGKIRLDDFWRIVMRPLYKPQVIEEPSLPERSNDLRSASDRLHELLSKRDQQAASQPHAAGQTHNTASQTSPSCNENTND